MQEDEVARRIDAHGEKIREHESAIAVLHQRAEAAEKERSALWQKKDGLDERLQQVRDEMNKNSRELRTDMENKHQEVMSAVSANKTAASVIAGERGAGKWILGFITTAILVLIGLGTLIFNIWRWATAG